MGQAFGRVPFPYRTDFKALNWGGARQEGTDRSHTKVVCLTGSFRSSVSELILNAKREMGAARGVGWWGGGRAQILSGLLAVIGAVQSRCFKAFGIIVHSGPHRAHTQSGHALFRWRPTLCAARQSVCTVGPSFPKSPLLRIINKQDGSLCSHFTASQIRSHNRKSCTCCRKILF